MFCAFQFQHNFDDPAVIDATVARSTYSFMKENESQFDEKLTKRARNDACGLPRDAGTRKSKIIAGDHGTGKFVLSEEVRTAISSKWKEVVEPVTGCASYDDLRIQLRSKLGGNQ